MKKLFGVIIAVIIMAGIVQAAEVVVSSLLDDPSFTAKPDAIMPTSGYEVWRYNSGSEMVQIQTSTNTSIVGDSSDFTAPINIFDDPEVTGQNGYDIATTKLTAITPAFSVTDIALVGVAGLYNQAQVFNSHYVITLGTTNGTYIATSGTTNIFEGADGAEMEANVISAWNTLTWDVDPFSSGGVVYQSITNISIKWFHETTVANTTDAGAWFNIESATIGYTALTLGDDLYFDGNGTDAGFGLTNVVLHQLDPTNSVWTTDPNGLTGHTTLSSIDNVIIETTGPSQVSLQWVADVAGDVAINKLTSRYAVGGAGWTRMQESTLSGPGEVNLSVNKIDSDTVNGPLALILASDITIVSDFEKVGAGDLTYSSGRVKQTGTATISDGAIVIQNISTVDTNSDFVLAGGELLFRNVIDDSGPLTATIGTISGSGYVSIKYTGDLTNLTVSCMGFDLTNDVATDLITFGWGSSCSLLSDAALYLDVSKNGSTLTNDYIDVDWPEKTFTLGGDLTITLLAGSDALDVGDSFDLFSDNLAGSFATVTLPTLGAGLAWDTTLLETSGIISVVRGPIDMYLDLNGTTAGFGLDNAASPITVDPTSATWNSDATGADGGVIEALIDGDTANFMLSGTNSVLFNWINYAGTTLGGIKTGIESGTPTIERMQKAGGGVEEIIWSDGAVVDAALDNSFWWDLGTIGDFTKAGNQNLEFGDGTVKVNGTCTISDGVIIINNLGTVSTNSSFKLGENYGLKFPVGIAGTVNMGTLGISGSGTKVITKDGGTGNLAGLTINCMGVNLTNNIAGDELRFGYSPSLSFLPAANTRLEINKSGGVPVNDFVNAVTRPFTMGGILTVIQLSGSESLIAGDSFNLFDGTMSGSFAETNLPALGIGLEWDTTSLEVNGEISVAKVSGGLAMYLDINGTNAGFGLDSTASPITVDPTTNTWNSDSSGGNGGFISSLDNGDSAYFMLSGSGGVLLNWTNYAGTALGGITTGVESGTPTIDRMQKAGGGLEAITWSTGAVVNVALTNSFWWDMTTSGDFSKTGANDLAYMDGVVKQNGTVTIKEGNIHIEQLGLVDANSSFILDGGGIVIKPGSSDTMNIGYLSGSGTITRSDTSDNLWTTVLYINSGLSMSNNAIDSINVDYGGQIMFGASASSVMEITKSGTVLQSDRLSTDWNRPFTLGGDLRVVLLSGSDQPVFGDSFNLFDAGANDIISGSFDSVTLPTLSVDLAWDTSLLGVDGSISVVRSSQGQDMYLDLNGTTTGFGLDSTVSPITVDPTVATWNSDATGGNGGYITPLIDGDTASFMLSGTASVLLNWTNYAGVVLGGIMTDVESGTPTIERMQKRGGGIEKITWADGAVVDAALENSFWWDLGTVGDFTKAGNQNLEFNDGTVKVNGTCTISDGIIIVNNLGTVSTNSSFKLGEKYGLKILGGLTGTVNMGTLGISGSGVKIITRDGTSGNLSGVTINCLGVNLTNGIAGDELRLGYSPSLTFLPEANTWLEINKSGGVPVNDFVNAIDRLFTMGGVLTVTQLSGSEVLAAGDSFNLFDGAIAGSFSSISLPALSSGLSWETGNLYIDGTIQIRSARGTLFKFK